MIQNNKVILKIIRYKTSNYISKHKFNFVCLFLFSWFFILPLFLNISIAQTQNEQLEYFHLVYELESEVTAAKNLAKNNTNTSDLAYLDPDSLEYQEDKQEKAEIKSAKKSKEVKPLSEEDELTSRANRPSAETDQEPDSKDKSKSQMPEEVGAAKKFEDPYETYNRGMYNINKQIDTYLIKPPAQFYAFIVPPPIKHMVSNFFENILDLNVVINDFLQGEHHQVPKSFSRFFINSTFGILGLIDVATDMGLPKKENDFGITFGKWSMPDSSYFVAPFLGPSTFRDLLGKGLGSIISIGYVFPDDYMWPLTGLGIIDKRANLLPLEKIIDTVSDDEYIFVRNSYLEYRNSLIRGEKPNTKKEEKETELLEDILSDEEDLLDTELEDLDSL